jgi:UDP-N-acetylglucosamine:LPS N-acetylglucosamine transferase
MAIRVSTAYRQPVIVRATTPVDGTEVAPGHVDVLLVCSAGGHLLQLCLLAEAWQGLSHAWVTLEREDARSLLAGETVFYASGPTTRNIPNLVKNLHLAWTLLRRLRPRVVVTTGAAVAVPFAWLGRLFGAKVVYVESLTRIAEPSVSCRLIRPVTDRLYVQWPELVRALPRARYVGNIFGQT